MVNYKIEHQRGFDYISSEDGSLCFRVVPPSLQNDEIAYTPYMAVAAVFEDVRPDLIREDFANDEDYENACYERAFGNEENERYDFLSLTIPFADDDRTDSNKEIWLDAINYYCQVMLDKPVVDLSPHNYNYDAEY